MSHLTVYVKNISSSTTEADVKEFFSFCGKIVEIKVFVEGETKSAEVTFEKETATKTALLLNNTQLGATHISVAGSPDAAARLGEDDGPTSPEQHQHHQRDGDSDHIPQEMKPRSRIVAEYLAHGYIVGEVGIQRAIELDNKHDVSRRFFKTISELDKKYQASDRARATSENYGLHRGATTLFGGLNSFFEQAKESPTGRKLARFYEDGAKEASDIVREAKRLAELKKQEHGGSAYKASGLEKFFGKEQQQQGEGEGAHHQQEPGHEGAAPAGEPVVSEKIVVEESSGKAQ